MERPYVILNAAMTLDGKIASKSGDSRISCDEDLDRVHVLRSEVDAIMVGIGTLLQDDPRLTVRRVDGDSPVRVIVDSEGRTPSDANVLDSSVDTIVAVSKKADGKEIDRLRSRGVQVLVAGDSEVDLSSLLESLKEMGIGKLLLEGGSTLNWGMLSEGLVDEIRIAISPIIIGGEKAKTLVGGLGFEKISQGVNLEFLRCEKVGRDLLLNYRVVRSSDD